MTTVQTTRNQSDAGALQELLGSVVGMPCWKAYTSIGSELLLYLGSKVPFQSKKLLGYKGERVLNVLASDWSIRDSSGSEAPVEALQGATIESARLLPEFGLVVTFDNGCTLDAIPSDEDKDPASLVPYWQFSISPTEFVEARPTRQWSILRSDEPY